MGSLTGCIREAGDLLSAANKAALHKRAGELRAQGQRKESGPASVAELLAAQKAALAELDQNIRDGVTLYEPVKPATPGAEAEQAAAGTRLDQVVREMPGLKVQADGMDAPMAAADYLAAVKAEADELAADAPLMQVAAECALLNGMAG